MNFKLFITTMLAVIMLFAMTACGKKQTTATSDKLDSDVKQAEQNDSKNSADKDSPTHGYEVFGNKSDKVGSDETSSNNSDDAWKEELEKSLFEEYGVIPEYYEDLGNGIYQVYVEVGGEVIPFVTVDSATGDYHG